MTGLNWYLEYGTSAAYSTTTAQVVNCGLFYVYQLKDPPQCDMAYCGYDVPGEKYFRGDKHLSFIKNIKIKQTSKQVGKQTNKKSPNNYTNK